MAAPRVLLADDDPRLVDLVSRYLRLEGYEVESVADGASAVESVTTQPPGLLILDIMMPGVDGLEACRMIRAHPQTRDLPILIFTALAEESEQARSAGADALLRKPFSLPTLAATVRTFFAQRAEQT